MDTSAVIQVLRVKVGQARTNLRQLGTPPEHMPGDDFAGDGFDATERATRAAQAVVLKNIIADCERALDRLRRKPNEFGICEDCLQPIADERLECQPWARYCVTCGETRAAKRRKRFH